MEFLGGRKQNSKLKVDLRVPTERSQVKHFEQMFNYNSSDAEVACLQIGLLGPCSPRERPGKEL